MPLKRFDVSLQNAIPPSHWRVDDAGCSIQKQRPDIQRNIHSGNKKKKKSLLAGWPPTVCVSQDLLLGTSKRIQKL